MPMAISMDRHRQRQCHHPAKLSRSLSYDEPDEAPAGTKCVAAAGYSIQRIAREMGMHRRTVRRYLAPPAPPRNRPPERPKPSGLSSPTLQRFVEYLQGQWQAGCANVVQLKRELDAQGYTGSYSLLMQAIQPWRGPRPPPEPGRGRRRGRPRVKRVNVRWLCLRPPDQLDHDECNALDEILLEDERLNAGYTLLQRFRRLIVRRSVRDLDQWLKDAGSSGLRPFVSLAHGIQSDYAAVVNGLKLPRSTGPVEGTVTKVKLIKRGLWARIHATTPPAPHKRGLARRPPRSRSREQPPVHRNLGRVHTDAGLSKAARS
jgi:hypothetical protein